MPLIAHLSELRQRLLISCVLILIGTIITFLYYHHLITWLISPYTQLQSTLPVITDYPLYIHSVWEGFMTKVKFSVYAGIVASSPLLLYQLLRFIIPGLKTTEKRMIGFALTMGTILAGLSVYFTYFYLIPYSLQFLSSTHFIPDNIGLILNFYQNIFYIFTLMISAMTLFQLPILMACCLYLNLISRQPLWRSGRYVTIACLILAALITPPDIITQLSIALPLISLYFLVLLIAKVFHWGDQNG